MSSQTIYCERCGDKLNPKKAVWLELSNTDGNYYDPKYFPNEHVTQGSFSFGIACSKSQLNETKLNLKQKN